MQSYHIRLNQGLYSLQKPKLMAILNASPDSFYAGNRLAQEKEVDAALEACVLGGADMLDVGGMSSRPGAAVLPMELELERLTMAMKRIRLAGIQLPVSVDTWRLEIAQAAVDLGASMVNDISGGLADERLPIWAAQMALPYVVMHRQGNSQTMQQNPQYRDALTEICAWFTHRLAALHALGLHDTVVDPGFGFGKSLAHNLELLLGLEHLQLLLERPILVGLSRKKMVQVASGVDDPKDALSGSLAAAIMALERGAHILRVHDVAETRQAIDFWWTCRKHQSPLAS